MKEILKRLELIKTSIDIDDEELIALQIDRLNNLEIDEEVKEIVSMLKKLDFGNSMVAIERYLEKYSGVVVYEDSELQGLRLELKALENKLQILSEDKNNCLNEIDEFNTLYSLKVGSIIEQILKLKKGLLKEQLNRVDEIDKDNLYQEYEEIKAEYKEFSREYEEIKQKEEDSFDLSDKEKEELKKLYKKASRLCHPDLVADELKEQAHKVMQELNSDYSNKNLARVKEILSSLENGTGFELASDSIDNKEILRAKIDELREKMVKTSKQIKEIKNDDTFKTIQEIEDMDDFFDSLKDELMNEFRKLEDELEENHIENSLSC